MMPPPQATLPITSSDNMDTDSLPKNYRAVTLRISAGRILTAQRAIQAAYPRAGGPVMTLGILHALKGQRSVEDLLRALPSALRPLLAFDRVSLALDRSVSGALWWHGLDAECAISRTDDQVPADLTALGLLSTCAMPLTTPHRALGTLEIASRRANAYSDDDVDLLAIVADAVAVTLDNALSHEQLREEHDRSTLLLELTNSLVSNLELRDVRTAVMRSARRIMRSDSAVVALPDADAGHLRAYALDFRDGGDLLQEGELIDAQGTIAAHVFRTGKPWVGRIKDVLESGLEVNPKWLELGFKVGCVLPLASRHRILGTLGLRRRDDTMYTDDEVNFLIQVANQIAVAVENALAYGEIRSLKDKVGEIPLDLQTKLLRVPQEREFERLGSGRTLRTDARLIAATNRDLAALVEEKRFRADLFYRLNVFPVHMPPLHERPEDIPLLVRHFVEHYARRMKRAVETIPSETMEVLTRYRWPGNVRELQNLMERAVILSPGPVLHVPLADLDVRATGGRPRGSAQTLEEAERAHIVATLTDTNWVVAGARGAAARLDMNRSTLQFRMKKLGIMRPKM